MNNYTFSTLNDKEFEHLVKDLVNQKFGLQLQAFKVGKDKGVDLRYSTPKNNNAIVVQVKHYVASNFAQLKHTLEKKELPKVQKLSPERYIIVTSLSLSNIEKDKLKDIFKPYILTSNDVLSQEDLNGILAENKEIEKQYFKLWFSSVTVFQSILNNAIEGRTKAMLDNKSRKISLYVVTKKLAEANRILAREKLLLITGQPGIGKTTLAEILIFEKAKVGFKIYKVENITEAETVLLHNDDENVLFYLDDFLGSNYSQIINSHRTETQLTSFVDRVKFSPNKYLILTTRTVILNHAIEKHEKISLSKLGNQQFELKLTDYNKYEKALILYNHLYFNNVQSVLYNSILNEKFYRTIIQHKNYTPRIIEFITDNSKIDQFDPMGYHQFILNNLNNPKEIWRYSYNNQIDYLDRCLLLTLFTFETNVNENTLIRAFDERLSYEKSEHNQIITASQFGESIRILLNGFISSSLYSTNPPAREYAFINPSLADFFIGYVAESYPERKSIVSSLAFIDQLDRFNPSKEVLPLEKELQTIIRDKISTSKLTINLSPNEVISRNKECAIYLETLCRYCPTANVDHLLFEFFKKISFEESWTDIFNEMEYFLNSLGDSPLTIAYVKDNFLKVIDKYISCISSYNRAIKIRGLFNKYGYDLDIYAQTEDGRTNLISIIDDVLRREEKEIEDRKDEITDFDEVSDLYYGVSATEEILLYEFFSDSSIDYESPVAFDEAYWRSKTEENSDRADFEAAQANDDDEDYFREEKIERLNEEGAIDDLFSNRD